MSGWHRDHPELAGTEADPWMIHAGYRQAVASGGVTDGMIVAAEEARDSALCECGHRWDEHDPDPPGGGHCELCPCRRHEEP